jgi:hypothetical protein
VCVGSNFRTVNWDFGTKKSKALLTSTISVLNGTPGILSLITMITYPVVEVFVFDDAPRVPVGIRYYTKGLNGIKVEGEMALKVKFSGGDLILIEKLRTVLSTIHEDTRTLVNYEEFSRDLHTFFGKWRDRSDYQLPPILPPPTTVDLRNTYMRLTMPYCVLTRIQVNIVTIYLNPLFNSIIFNDYKCLVFLFRKIKANWMCTYFYICYNITNLYPTE